jgi:anaerobic magnesium-protoporphyrin IX monomethyl ester cyclase
MNVLLLSMPDSFEHMPSLAVRMPNGALTSIAGNVDPHHRVAVADLVLVQRHVRETITRLIQELEPDVVGLSVMTFQRPTARKVVRLVRRLQPEAVVVVGGYDPSLAPDAYESFGEDAPDFLVRAEGEVTFRDLLRSMESGAGFEEVAGLSRLEGGQLVHNAARPVHRLKDDTLALPKRSARVLEGYTFLGRKVDVVETSRGCTFDCSFCSIVEMRGRNFHAYPIERVIADLEDARAWGARHVFFVDDNVMLNADRFAALCEAIIRAGLNRLDYTVQAMTSSIANHGEGLATLMRRAGFRYVFLGIENVLDEDLDFLQAQAKNTRREGRQKKGNASLRAVELIRRNGMYVVGGLIVGNPGDTPAAIEANLAFARRHVDWPYIQHPTPYPGTPMTRAFEERGLIASHRVEEYDGTTAVVHTEHLPADEAEYLRWRAERWMKLRHMPVALAHDPLFVLRNAPRMLRHTFRGTTLRTVLGLESDRAAFRRYRAMHAAERAYL